MRGRIPASRLVTFTGGVPNNRGPNIARQGHKPNDPESKRRRKRAEARHKHRHMGLALHKEPAPRPRTAPERCNEDASSDKQALARRRRGVVVHSME